jgi:hypothetical protein
MSRKVLKEFRFLFGQTTYMYTRYCKSVRRIVGHISFRSRIRPIYTVHYTELESNFDHHHHHHRQNLFSISRPMIYKFGFGFQCTRSRNDLCLWLYSPFLDFGRFSSFVILYTVGRTPWTGDQPVARPLPTHRTTQIQNKGIHRHPCLELVRTHDPRVRVGEDGSCLRPRGHCDRQLQ